MISVLVVSDLAGDARSARRSANLRALAARQDGTLRRLSPGSWVHTGARLGRPRELRGWRLIGDVLDRRDPPLPAADPVDDLFNRHWGRYIGLRLDAGGRVDALLRDPSGAVECFAWCQDGLLVATSHTPAWLIAALKPDWRIRRGRVAAALRNPLWSAGPLLLDGPTAVPAGAVQPVPLDAAADVRWRPARFARRSLDPPPTADDAARRLRAAIDESVAGLCADGAALGVEVSGGLDSAIIATSLHAQGADVRVRLNAYGPTPASDERAYVSTLAARLQSPVNAGPHAVGPLSEDLFAAISQDARPGVNGLDPHHDLDWSARLRQAGAEALFTGKGGDSILLQHASADVFVDHWRQAGWRTLLAPDTSRLAAFNEVSVWTLLAKARQYRGPQPTWLRRNDELFGADPGEGLNHPWLENEASFGPAKTLQIAGVVDSVSRHGPSLLTSSVDVRHPLCAQPVIETCLALPAWLLTIGGRDRGLARRAFADRLPPEILQRRSKGDMTRLYGRMILDNLTLFRALLLDGRLAEEGLIDRQRADALLSAESLSWRGRYSAIIMAAAFEAWVRVWEDRLGRRMA